jgi:glycosyltransferase involved in cell wall biosynthesis
LKILIISADVIKKTMAGPGIRCYEIARCLSKQFEITLAIPNEIEIFPKYFIIKSYDKNNADSIKRLAIKTDVLLLGHLDVSGLSFLYKLNKPVIVDLYSPSNLETLEWYSHESLGKRRYLQERGSEIINKWLGLGDFFICASEIQRSYWLGMLAANYRLLPNAYDEEKSFRNILDIVPFGLPSSKPKHTHNVLKGVVDGINPNDTLMIWGGGIWNWLDPLTYIRAVADISKNRADIKLFFMGKGHPNNEVPEMKMYNQAVKMSQELGVYQKAVFFNDGWVPYDERSNYLLEADIGVCGHFINVETEFSFRTRVLDYLWSELPVISTEGDAMADLVKSHGLGEVVEAENTTHLKDAILKLSHPEYRSQCSTNIRRISNRFSWENAVQPLIRFCQNPRKMESIGLNLDSISKAGDVKGPARTLEGRVLELEKSVERVQTFLNKILLNRFCQFFLKLRKKLSFRKNG